MHNKEYSILFNDWNISEALLTRAKSLRVFKLFATAFKRDEPLDMNNEAVVIVMDVHPVQCLNAYTTDGRAKAQSLEH